MELAVLILTHKRLDLLKKCLESIRVQDQHPFTTRLCILVNGEDPETEAFLAEKGVEFDSVSDPLSVGEARNLLIDKISEPYICFLDDDIRLPADYFKKAAEIIKKYPDVDIFGGPDQSPPESSEFQRCLGMVMESYLANGPTNKRHKLGADSVEVGGEINLILCNFWAKTRVFSIQKFPKDFKRNEENYLLSVLSDQGISMMRVPNLFVYHARKVSVSKLARVIFLAGMYRVVSMIDYPRSIRPIFFLHQVLVGLLAWVLVADRPAACLMIGAYLIVIGIASMRIAFATRRALDFPLSMLLFIVYNFAYPLGQFAGYFRGVAYRMEKH